MKIAAKAVEAFLGNPTMPYGGALLYGVDSGLVRERVNRIRKAVLPQTDDFAYVEMNESALIADPARLSDKLAAIAMLSPKRLVMLRDISDKSAKIIDAALPSLHPGVFLLVAADELSSRSSLRALFEKHERLAAVACYKDEQRDVQGVVREKLDAASIRYDREVIDYLAGCLGNDRYVTYQELEKIITYAGDAKTLALEDVKALVDYNRDTHIDDVVHAVADRSLSALEATLTRLLREGTQPIVYLRGLQRYFNRLYWIRTQMQSGQSAEQAVQAIRPPIFFRQMPQLIKHAQQWQPAQITKALGLLASAELACKTSDMPAIAASSRLLFQVTQVR